MSIITDYTDRRMSLNEIAEARSTSYSKVRAVLLACGVTLRPPVRPGGLRDPKRAARLVEMRRQGKTYQQIVTEARCSRKYLLARLREAGMVRRVGQ